MIYSICIRAPILIAIQFESRVSFLLLGLRLLYHGASYSYWVRFKKNDKKYVWRPQLISLEVRDLQ